MNVVLIGYGKMGKSIEKELLLRGHKIKLKTSITPKIEDIINTDVAIEFTNPYVAFKNIELCIKNNIPVISGTTGWLEKINIIKNLCKELNGSFVYSSNFSIGINIIFKLNKLLAQIMSKYNNYNISIEEIHHIKKIDKPSGTSISIAEEIIKKTYKKKWTLTNNNKKDELVINSRRLNNNIGTHTIKYESNIDKIEIKHEAFDRKAFSIGAVIAAEWIINKKGFFSMEEVLGL